MNDKVVVIGGSGFLGSHLADELSANGYRVVIFDQNKSEWLKPNQEMVIGDIMNEEEIARCVEGSKYVYHLAGVADIDAASVDPLKTMEYNVIGAVKVLEACRKAGVERVVYASTVYVYSSGGSFYRVSKQAVEDMISVYQKKYGLDFTILRYGSLYGPRSQQWNGIKRFVRQAVMEGKIIYPGTGNERREYINVKDASRLSVEALGAKYANKCLTLTGTHVLNTKELFHMVSEIMGGDVEITFDDKNLYSDHYEITPYRYAPREGLKMVSNVFADIGQGLFEMIEEVHHEKSK